MAGATPTRQQELYNSKIFSDATLFFGVGTGTKFAAHMAILSMGSEWFYRVALNKFESDAYCGIELRLGPDYHNEMHRLLRHLYGFKVFPAPYPSTIDMDIKLLELAHKYEVAILIEKTEESIVGRLRGMRDDKTETAATCAVVLDGIYKLPKGNEKLRQLAAEACHRHMAGLVADDAFQKTLLKFPEIGADLMKRPTVSVKSDTEESKKRRRV